MSSTGLLASPLAIGSDQVWPSSLRRTSQPRGKSLAEPLHSTAICDSDHGLPMSNWNHWPAFWLAPVSQREPSSPSMAFLALSELFDALKTHLFICSGDTGTRSPSSAMVYGAVRLLVAARTRATSSLVIAEAELPNDVR